MDITQQPSWPLRAGTQHESGGYYMASCGPVMASKPVTSCGLHQAVISRTKQASFEHLQAKFAGLSVVHDREELVSRNGGGIEATKLVMAAGRYQEEIQQFLQATC